uniref:Uncharacterized protein n=1 Tax=viral metagenome TaxID=1070528 RepID=A0A6M3LBR0_9ZZZZ
MGLKIVLTIFLIVMFSLISPSEFIRSITYSDYDTCDYHMIKMALIEHDKGNDARWVLRILDDGVLSYTNSGRNFDDYAQLRVWTTKIESQYPEHTGIE